MKTKAVIISAILLTLFFAGAAALPNLKLNRLEYSPLSERIVAQVLNDSGENVESFMVAIFVDGKLYHMTSEELGLSLGPNSRISVYADFTDDGNSHSFFASADPQNEVEESNEEDNIKSARLEGWEETIVQPRQQSQPPAETGFWNQAMLNQVLLALAAALAILAIAYIAVIYRRKKE